MNLAVFIRITQVGAIALTIAIGILSVLPNPDDLTGGHDIGAILSKLLFGTPRYGDKVAHFIAYSALGTAGALGFSRGEPLRLTIIVGILSMYGGVLELIQALGRVRVPDPLDFAANAAGLGVGALVAFGLWHALSRLAGRPI